MVWGLKTSVDTDVSAHIHERKLARGLAATGLGVVFVLLAPGQITTANYTSSIDLAKNQINSSIEAPVLRAESSFVFTQNFAEKSIQKTVIKDTQTETKSVVQSIVRTPENPKPIQLASLDLQIPEINKPRDFVPNVEIKPPVLRTTPKSRPKLKKKLFGSVELKFDDERKIKAWSSVYGRFLSDVSGLKSCLGGGCGNQVLANWAHELRPLQTYRNFKKSKR